MYQDLKDFLDKLKGIWFRRQEVKKPHLFLPIPETINQFTGLEILTRVEGEIVSRCLHEADVKGPAKHWYLQPFRLDAYEQLTGYTLKIHKDIY